MLDYGALTPEINSARMYTGPGSGPLLAAATAWDGLAGELGLTANAYGLVISGLTGGPWRGPASSAMAAAAAPYVGWMATTSAQAGHAAAQAKAAAGAYETAFAMTVPPPVIAANRSLLMSLIATNALGQNTPAIAATEAHYAEMWAQDAAAMYGYAGSSAAASTVTPFTAPPSTTATTGLAAQAAAITQTAGNSAATTAPTALSQLTSSLPTALQSLGSPMSAPGATSALSGMLASLNPFAPGSGSSTSGLTGFMNMIGGTDGSAMGSFLNSNLWNTIFSSGFFMPANWLGTMSEVPGLLAGTAVADAASADALGAAAASGLAAEGSALGGFGSLGGVSAGLGQAAMIGPLSVPPSWVPPVPMSPVVSPLPGLGVTPGISAGGVPSMLGGMPLTAAGGHGVSGGFPRYGFRPTVMAHPPAAG